MELPWHLSEKQYLLPWQDSEQAAFSTFLDFKFQIRFKRRVFDNAHAQNYTQRYMDPVP